MLRVFQHGTAVAPPCPHCSAHHSRSSADEVGAEFTVQQVHERFPVVGWRFGGPQVCLGLVDRVEDGGGGVLVDDPQRPPVRGAFAAVSADLGADLLQAAELFGQQGERDKPWEAPCPGAIRPQREDGRHA